MGVAVFAKMYLSTVKLVLVIQKRSKKAQITRGRKQNFTDMQ